MKALKLIAIAIVTLAAIIGLLFLNEGNSSTAVTGDKNKQMEKMKKELLNEWYTTQQWDVASFDNILDRLKQNKRELGNGYQTLVDLTGELACHRLDSLVMEEFAKADCDKSQIDIYSNGLDHLLVKVSHLRNNGDVKKMQGIIDVYNKAYTLSKRDMGLSTGFNVQTDQWNSFSNYSNSVKRQKNDIQASEYFQYINHVTEIIDGLSKVDSRLAVANNSFKARLAQDIIKAYRQKDPKETERLKQVYDRFQREFGDDNNLNTFVQNY